jgi:hypothetical protein
MISKQSGSCGGYDVWYIETALNLAVPYMA